jgi:hypothetical protein
MESALDFYPALGARLVHGSRDGDFTLLRVGALNSASWRTHRIPGRMKAP